MTSDVEDADMVEGDPPEEPAVSSLPAASDDVANVESSRRYKALRNIELDLFHGFRDSIGSVLWINESHYMAFIFDYHKRYLSYSDSLASGKVPRSIQKVFSWWIK